MGIKSKLFASSIVFKPFKPFFYFVTFMYMIMRYSPFRWTVKTQMLKSILYFIFTKYHCILYFHGRRIDPFNSIDYIRLPHGMS